MRLVDGNREARPFFDDGSPFCLYLGFGEVVSDPIEPGEVKRYWSLHPDLGSDTVTVRAGEFDDVEDIAVVDVNPAPASSEPAVITTGADPGLTLEVAASSVSTRSPCSAPHSSTTPPTRSG